PDELAGEMEKLVKDGAFADTGELMRCAALEFMARRGKQQAAPAGDDSRAKAYQRRAQLLEEAWRVGSSTSSGRTALTLSALVSAMRQSSQSAEPSTSMYFAGADVDHPYFLQSD